MEESNRKRDKKIEEEVKRSKKEEQIYMRMEREK
jgi:hypothetical protein